MTPFHTTPSSGYSSALAGWNGPMPAPDHLSTASLPLARSELGAGGPPTPHDQSLPLHAGYTCLPSASTHASTSPTPYTCSSNAQFSAQATDLGFLPSTPFSRLPQLHLRPLSHFPGATLVPTKLSPSAPTHNSNSDARGAPEAAMLSVQPLLSAECHEAPISRGPPEPWPTISMPASLHPGENVPRLPRILQVENQTVTSDAIQVASISRRRCEATFVCPVPKCGATFTRRFNLDRLDHLRSHTAERPFRCEWPGCLKSFTRRGDCRRHYDALHTKSRKFTCGGCGKSFSRIDALYRHLNTGIGEHCRRAIAAASVASNRNPSYEEAGDAAANVPSNRTSPHEEAGDATRTG